MYNFHVIVFNFSCKNRKYDEALEYYNEALRLLNEAGFSIGHSIHSGVQSLRSNEDMTVCLATSGLGLIQHKLILSRYCSKDVVPAEYSRIFNESSEEFRGLISTALGNLEISYDVLVDELNLRFEINALSKENLSTFGSVLLEIAASLQDLNAHLHRYTESVSRSSRASTLMLLLSDIYRDSNDSYLKSTASMTNFSLRSFRSSSEDLKKFKMIPPKLRNLICKLLHTDAQILRKVLASILTGGSDVNSLSILEMAKRIYNIRIFISYELCDLMDEMNFQTSGSSMAKLSIDELANAAGLCAQIIGTFPFDFDNSDLVNSIQKLINCRHPDFNFDRIYIEYFSTFHDIFTSGSVEDDDYLVKIIGAYNLSGELFLKFQDCLMLNISEESQLSVVFEGIHWFYYTGVCWMYASFTSTASDLVESKCEVSERAERMFTNAKSIIQTYFGIISPCLEVNSCKTEEMAYKNRDWLTLSGDISYHLSFMYLRLHQLGSQRSNSLTYALEEANYAKECYSQVLFTF